MDKNSILTAVLNLRKATKKRNFNQSIDLIINLKDLDLKKPEHKIDIFLTLPAGVGKKIKVAGLVDKELSAESKQVLDKTILREDFQKLTKQQIKKLAGDHNFFVAQANIMTDIAKYFGKILGPKNRMPNPKAGCVVPPETQLKLLYDKLQKTRRLQIKNEPIIKCLVGKEDMSDEEIANNILAVYNGIISVLPLERQNIGKVLVKMTMGAPVNIGDKNAKSS